MFLSHWQTSLSLAMLNQANALKVRKRWQWHAGILGEILREERGHCLVIQQPSHCKEAKRGSKWSHSKSPVAKSSKPGSSLYDATLQIKMAKVDEIFQKLNDTHDNKYSAEQKRAWAHLLDKHEFVIELPKTRFFQSSNPTFHQHHPFIIIFYIINQQICIYNYPIGCHT